MRRASGAELQAILLGLNRRCSARFGVHRRSGAIEDAGVTRGSAS